jgi:hypothetical protein
VEEDQGADHTHMMDKSSKDRCTEERTNWWKVKCKNGQIQSTGDSCAKIASQVWKQLNFEYLDVQTNDRSCIQAALHET